MDQGLRITVPNELLVVPDAYIAPSGQAETNNSAAALLISPTLDENTADVPILGRPFFSSAYLMVDLDAQTFTLWQANATTDERLVTVGGACADAPKVNDAPANATTGHPATTSSASSNPSNSSFASDSSAPAKPSKSVSAGTIAGIVVGVLCGLAVVVGAFALFFIRSRRRRAALASNQGNLVLNKYGSGSETVYGSGNYTSPKQRFPEEMSAEQDQSYELLAHERPLEVPGGPWDSRPVELPASRYSKT